MAIPHGALHIFTNKSATVTGKSVFKLWLRQYQLPQLQALIQTTTLTAIDATTTDPAVIPRNIKQVVRRRYPGGPPISVPAGSRRVVVHQDSKRSTFPGRPITLEVPKDGSQLTAVTLGKKMKVLQITLEGSFPDFFTFVEQHNAKPFVLRTNNGSPIFIAHSGA
jgi:hypothetical protein